MDTKFYPSFILSYVFSDEFAALDHRTQVGTHHPLIAYIDDCSFDAKWLAEQFNRKGKKLNPDKAGLLAISSQLYKVTESLSEKSVRTLEGCIEVIPVYLSTKEEKIRESLKHLVKINGSDDLPDEFLESFYQMFEDDDFDPSEINEVSICKYTRKLIDLQLAIAEKTTNGKNIPSYERENWDYAVANKKLIYTEETCRLFDEYYR